MKIEIIIDTNCLSKSSIYQMINQLNLEFADSKIAIIQIESDFERLQKLGINVLPSWLLNGELLSINPFDYHSLRDRILQTKSQY